MKKCNKCGINKSLEGFWLDKNKYDGHASTCAQCCKDHRKNNSQLYKKYKRTTHLRSCYGITPEQYNEMLLSQGAGCAICFSTNPGSKENFSVDHCHKTNQIRGLLCDTCNRGIGLLKDDPEILQQASEYLKKSYDTKSKVLRFNKKV